MQSIIKILLLCVLFSTGCKSIVKQSDSSQQINSDSVTLVFVDPPELGSFTEWHGRASTIGASYISYMSDKYPVYLEKGSLYDTVVLPTNNGFLEISHIYKGLQFINFYLKGGDTVTFTYNDLKQPIANSGLSEELTYRYNFANNIEGVSDDFGFNPLSLYQEPWVFYYLSLQYPRQEIVFDSIYRTKLTPYIENYRTALDSARLSGALDSVYLNYYEYQYDREKNQYDLYTRCSKDWKNYPKNIAKNLIRMPLDDNLVDYISYYNSILQSYKTLGFDAIASDSLIPPVSKKLILYDMLRICNIPGWTKQSPEYLETHYAKFIAATGDSLTINRLKADFSYLYVAPEDVKTGDMILADMEDKTTTFENVIAKHRGKVLYVDFWASWCPPCIGNMPDALKIREEYKGKDIVFIYLALSDAPDKWRSAIKAHRIDYLGENYFITSQHAEILTKLKISQIPRYIIFDKSGTLVDSNAPRPHGSEIRNVLNKYLQ